MEPSPSPGTRRGKQGTAQASVCPLGPPPAPLPPFTMASGSSSTGPGPFSVMRLRISSETGSDLGPRQGVSKGPQDQPGPCAPSLAQAGFSSLARGTRLAQATWQQLHSAPGPRGSQPGWGWRQGATLAPEGAESRLPWPERRQGAPPAWPNGHPGRPCQCPSSHQGVWEGPWQGRGIHASRHPSPPPNKPLQSQPHPWGGLVPCTWPLPRREEGSSQPPTVPPSERAKLDAVGRGQGVTQSNPEGNGPPASRTEMSPSPAARSGKAAEPSDADNPG